MANYAHIEIKLEVVLPSATVTLERKAAYSEVNSYVRPVDDVIDPSEQHQVDLARMHLERHDWQQAIAALDQVGVGKLTVRYLDERYNLVAGPDVTLFPEAKSMAESEQDSEELILYKAYYQLAYVTHNGPSTMPDGREATDIREAGEAIEEAAANYVGNHMDLNKATVQAMLQAIREQAYQDEAEDRRVAHELEDRRNS